MSDTMHSQKTPVQSGVPAPRIAREQSTITAMVGLYCQGHHGSVSGLCRDCEELLAYALQRLEVCPFQEFKPACNRCEVHCYSPKQRERVRQVMRYAGPRMLLRHPVMAIRHLLDKQRPTPRLKTRQKR